MIDSVVWKKIVLYNLGLRSEDNPTEIKSAAAYAMSCDCAWNAPIPDNWETLLINTISHILNYPNSDKRYLLIVAPTSNDVKSEYKGMFPLFPKSSGWCTKVYASTPLRNESVASLKNWVLDTIKIEDIK